MFIVQHISSPLGGRQHWAPLLVAVLVVLLFLPINLWAAKPADVRVVIDISGSMKKNDPKNLRQPALRLLVSLMQDDTYAGVWTFGQYVNMVAKWGKVDAAWKAEAMKAASGINSRGLHTNIEEALRRATRGWQKPDHHRRRHLVLLTDGFVDISKDPAVNAESRRRILQEVLPGLEADKVTIHSIALSNNVDYELLYALSGATDGWYERVDDASQLPKVFLRIFENAVIPDALPLKDNRFKIDKSISDVTVLLFRKDKHATTIVVSPDSMQMTPEKHPKTVSWQHEQSYDLINIKQPQTGEWNIKADVDPDNRVLIVTNLQLTVDTLATNLLVGDQFDVKARLQEQGKTLAQGDLLNLLQFETSLHTADTEIEKQFMRDDGKAPDVLQKDGVYSAGFKALTMPGRYEVVVHVSGGVIEREYRHSINVYDTAASIEIKADKSDFNVVIRPHAGLLRPETVSMQTRLADGKIVNLQQVDDSTWLAKIPKTYEHQLAQIVLTGTRYNNQSLTQKFEQTIAATPGEQALKLAAPNKAAPVKKLEHADTKTSHKPDEKKTNKQGNTAKDVKKQKKGFDWTFVIILIVAINGLLLIGGGLGYYMWKKRKVTQLAEEDKEMEI